MPSDGSLSGIVEDRPSPWGEVSMGLWPTQGNENYRCRPRERGDPLSRQWIPACAGMTYLGLVFRRVPMGLQPTRRNENRPRGHPRESGGPSSVRNTMDSRLRGNDVLEGDFQESPRRRGISQCVENTQSEILRFARNDTPKEVFTRTPWEEGVARRRFLQPSRHE